MAKRPISYEIRSECTVRKITAVRPKGHRIRSEGEVKISAILKGNVASDTKLRT